MAARSAISKPTRGVTRRDGGLGSRRDGIPGANGTKGKGETQASPPTNRGEASEDCRADALFCSNHISREPPRVHSAHGSAVANGRRPHLLQGATKSAGVTSRR